MVIMTITMYSYVLVSECNWLFTFLCSN
uniref:Uncharacterized protein n=1 Tax=Anguilla anguilla TaxID=7936 RepID=A0A0E9Q0E8_ANGAN